MNDNTTPEIREYGRTARRNILNALGISGEDPEAQQPSTLQDRLADEMQGTFTFELIEADTGEVVQQVEENTVVNDGENEILRWVGGIPVGPVTQTFSGDGSTTTFQLPYPYYPVETISNVTVDGTAQDETATDFALDYWDGTIYFSSAPSSGTDNISVDVEYVQHPFRWLAVGTDGTSTSGSDSSLYSESERIDLDPNTNSGEYSIDTSSQEIVGSWLFGTNQANVSIAEAGLFGMPGGATAAGSADDTMLNRTVVSPTIDKTSSQELKVTWTLSM